MPPRCFVAVELPTEARDLLAAARVAFLDVAPDWAGEKWVRPELLHLTLKFIGPLADPVAPDALNALAAVGGRHAPFDLTVAGIRATPSPGRASMLWATFGGDLVACAGLASEIDATFEHDFGIPGGDHRFKAHVTLVRARERRRAPADALATAQARIEAGKGADSSVSVRSVTLISSTLGPRGPVYEALGSRPLIG